jgi:hypothetical protein
MDRTEPSERDNHKKGEQDRRNPRNGMKELTLPKRVSFMHYDLGFFDHETCRLGAAQNPFGAKVLPMSPV